MFGKPVKAKGNRTRFRKSTLKVCDCSTSVLSPEKMCAKSSQVKKKPRTLRTCGAKETSSEEIWLMNGYSAASGSAGCGIAGIAVLTVGLDDSSGAAKAGCIVQQQIA